MVETAGGGGRYPKVCDKFVGNASVVVGKERVKLGNIRGLGKSFRIVIPSVFCAAADRTGQ